MKKILTPLLFSAVLISLSVITSRGQSLCSDFGINGMASTLESHITRFNSAVVLASGKIVAVGYFDDNRDKDFLVARYNSNGTPDNTFGTNGLQVFDITGTDKDDVAMTVTTAPDGNLLVGGVSAGYGTIIKISTAGSLVTTFGTSGKIVYPILYSSVESILVGSDDVIYGIGKTFDTDNIVIRQLGIRAFDQSGTAITTYGENGHYYNRDYLLWHTDQIDAALQSDGKLLVTGSFGAPDNIDLWRVIRINTNGTVDTSFGSNGVMEEGEPAAAKVEDIKLGADGSIYLGGAIRIDSDLPSLAMVKKRNSNGSPNTAFNSTGSATHSGAGDNAVIGAIEIDGNGKVYIAGSKMNANDETDFLLTAFNANGTVDSNFGVHVDRMAGSNGGALSDLIRLADGSFIACGYLEGADHAYGVVVKYKPTGELDENFGAGGSTVARLAGEGSMKAIAMTADGKIVTAGTYLHNGSNTGIAVARFNADGSPDLSFGTYGYVRYDINENRQFVNAIHLYNDGKILVAGNTLHPTSGEDYLLVKLNANGSPDTGFGTNGVWTKHHGAYGKNNTLQNIRVDSQGRVMIMGDANYLGGSYVDATVMRILADGSADASFGTNGVVRVTLTSVNDFFYDVAIMDDGTFMALGAGTVNVGGVVVKILADGTLDQTFGTNGIYHLPWADDEEHFRPIRVLSTANNKLLMGGIEKDIDQVFDRTPVLYRINTSGEVDVTFDGDGNKSFLNFHNVDVLPGWLVADGKIVVAGEMPTSEGDFAIMILDENGNEEAIHHFTIGEDGIVGLLKNSSGNYYAGLSTETGIGVVVCLNPEGTSGSPTDCNDLDDPLVSKEGDALMSTEADTYQWYKDGNIIGGATDRTIAIDLLDAAIYQVEVTIGECVLYSDEYVYVITGISPEKARSISVYPNPVKSDIVIQSETDLRGTDIGLYSSQGVLINRLTAPVGFSTTLSGEGLLPGVYFLRAQSPHGLEVIKIIKMH